MSNKLIKYNNYFIMYRSNQTSFWKEFSYDNLTIEFAYGMRNTDAGFLSFFIVPIIFPFFLLFKLMKRFEIWILVFIIILYYLLID